MGTTFAIDVPAALIARLRAGDRRAFEQVYRWFERPVYALAWRILGDADEAQEILHDAMLAVFERLDQYRSEAPFWGWLRQIAVNESLMRLRKRRLDYVEEVPEVLEGFGHEPAPLAALASHDLARAMADLPALTRSVVWLYYVEGYTHDEIAKAFDKSISFSKSQVMRGTERLRKTLVIEPARVAYA